MPRNYSWAHQKLRKRLAPAVAAGLYRCWRCGEPIRAGVEWDLGHDDSDRSITHGPEHRHARDCAAGGNRATQRKGRATATNRPRWRSRRW